MKTIRTRNNFSGGSSRMKSKIFLLAVLITTLSKGISFSDEIYKGRPYLDAQAGYFIFEGDDDLKDAPVYGGRFGQYLTNNIGVDVGLLRGRSDVKKNKFSSSFFVGSVEPQYHFGQGRLRPYLSAGVAVINAERHQGKNDADFAYPVGGGLKWLATKHVMARLDGRYFYNTGRSNGNNDALVSGGLGWLFGGIEMPKEDPDTDGDGVKDSKDKCPNTPSGTAVDEVGCPLPVKKVELDTDADGVIDANDQCPGTPLNIKVDAKGCPLDSDNDGIDDAHDRCPNTPEGVWVDAYGCAVEMKGKDKAEINLFLKFDTGKAEISSEYETRLLEMADFMKRYPKTKVEIEGHTDSMGSPKLNMTLSERRAAAVRLFLIDKGGIQTERITSKGYGETKPVASNSTPEGRATNRRVVGSISTIQE